MTRYRSFVNNCKAGKEAEELSTLQPLLEADGNWSLARCAIQHLIERRILELKAIFVTIPVRKPGLRYLIIVIFVKLRKKLFVQRSYTFPVLFYRNILKLKILSYPKLLAELVWKMNQKLLTTFPQ